MPSASGTFNVGTITGCYAGRSKMYLAALATYFGSMAMGTVLGYSSPALHDMDVGNSKLKPSQSEGAWIGSIMTVGALAGSLIAGPVTERFGIRTTLVFSVIPFTAGWFFIVYAKAVWSLLIGRIITGMCCGLVSLAVPMYLAEISTLNRRGIIGSGFQTTVVLALLIVYALGDVLSWVNLALVCACFPIVMSGMMLFMPETPRWLISKRRRLEAAEAIYFLHGAHVDPEESCQELQENFEQQPKGKVSFQEFYKPHIYKPVIICLMIMFFQQWSGINGVMFFASSMFQESGYDKITASASSIILGAAQVIGTVIGAAAVEKTGRKILLLFSSFFMVLGLTALSILFGLANLKGAEFMKQYGWIEVVSLAIYVLAFAIGYGPIPWLIMSELIPSRVKGLAGAFATFFNWTNAFLVTNQFQNMRESMNYGAYIFLDAITILGFIYVIIFLPETKGKSLEDIESFFFDSDVEPTDEGDIVSPSNVNGSLNYDILDRNLRSSR